MSVVVGFLLWCLLVGLRLLCCSAAVLWVFWTWLFGFICVELVLVCCGVG